MGFSVVGLSVVRGVVVRAAVVTGAAVRGAAVGCAVSGETTDGEAAAAVALSVNSGGDAIATDVPAIAPVTLISPSASVPSNWRMRIAKHRSMGTILLTCLRVESRCMD